MVPVVSHTDHDVAGNASWNIAEEQRVVVASLFHHLDSQVVVGEMRFVLFVPLQCLDDQGKGLACHDTTYYGT